MHKLSRKANVLIYAIVILSFFIVSYCLIDPEKEEQYSITLVAENQKMISTYVDAISNERTSSDYQACYVILEAGTKMSDFILTSKQEFIKYIKLEGPKEGEVLTEESENLITHYAYSLLLIGDIQEKTNMKTNEKTYEVVNARITYDKIPLVLREQDDIILRNKDKTKEKTVHLQDFIKALKSVEERDEMISWS